MSCYNCKDRFINEETGERCHTTCEKYLSFRNKLDTITMNKRNDDKLNQYVIGTVIRDRDYKTR